VSQPQLPADPVTAAQECFQRWLDEATGLRDTRFFPDVSWPLPRYREALETARGNMDRLEELYRGAVAYKGAMSRLAATQQDAYDERWNRLAATANQTGRGAREYEGSRERYARFDLDCFEERRRARQWKIAAGIAADAAEILKIMYFGLKDARLALVESMRAFAAESSLDR
jgi:hypothetical protein